ncbi:hypothetical protein GPA10_40350 [Streptomyces sp. p1417]|uniref:Uncharacterized protein n=1 Tax=Streptomyces typhae TaxID=2681492 RepID=A0A6L6XC75_9ACTN|nr:hypothetical protein [Streptomyces typhae]
MQRPDEFTGGGLDRALSPRGNVPVVTRDPGPRDRAFGEGEGEDMFGTEVGA